MPRWFNDKSNRRKPYGSWKFYPDGSLKNSSVIQFTNFTPNEGLQKKVKDLLGQCSFCLLRFQSINHFHCTKCIDHTICVFCKDKFSPGPNSFLQVCEICWKHGRIEITSNEDFEKFFLRYEILRESCKSSDSNDNEEDDRHGTDRDSDPVLA
jgi:hypothetical protein